MRRGAVVRAVEAALLVVYTVGLAALARSTSLWGDEGFTAAMVHLPVRTILSDLRHIDVNMGLYYLGVVPFERVLGSGELALRLLSVLCVAAALPVFVHLTTPWIGPTAARCGAVALALDPFTITLAATARPYALLLLGALLTSTLVVRAVRPTTAQPARRRRLLGWAALASALLYVHLLAVPVIAAQAAYALTRRRGLRHRPGRADAWALAPALLLLAVAAGPTAAFIAPRNTLSWVGPASVSSAVSAVGSLLGGRVLGTVLLALTAVGAVCLIVRARSDRRSAGAAGGVGGAGGAGEAGEAGGIALLGWLVAVPVLLILAVAPVQSLLVDLYLTPLLIPLFALVGCAVAALGRWLPRPPAVAGAACLLLLAGGTIGRQVASAELAQPQDWRSASSLLDDRVRPGDAVAFPNMFYRIVAEYYAERTPTGSPGLGTGWETAAPVLPEAPWGSLRPYELDRDKRLGSYDSEPTLTAELAGRRSVWLVGPDDPLVHRARDRLTASGWRITDVGQVRGVSLVHLTR